MTDRTEKSQAETTEQQRRDLAVEDVDTTRAQDVKGGGISVNLTRDPCHQDPLGGSSCPATV